LAICSFVPVLKERFASWKYLYSAIMFVDWYYQRQQWKFVYCLEFLEQHQPLEIEHFFYHYLRLFVHEKSQQHFLLLRRFYHLLMQISQLVHQFFFCIIALADGSAGLFGFRRICSIVVKTNGRLIDINILGILRWKYHIFIIVACWNL